MPSLLTPKQSPSPPCIIPTPAPVPHPVQLTLNPRQAQALKTGLEQIKTLLVFTGLDEKEGYSPFYKIAGLYQEVIDMLPGNPARELQR